ncbi:protein FAR-RED IMPAIRED RESPONSE 1 [Sesamum angolense]|uniref:Protein FAR1-RELATED SEQUENCE n=1 Tax=Sesamum angolense TaxID=2727404 RepID=A0AAE2BI62_9LAMI|nr:protein FAR-RED IMPAIRED RESPONSE 1 [Sesamum angolense]
MKQQVGFPQTNDCKHQSIYQRQRGRRLLVVSAKQEARTGETIGVYGGVSSEFCATMEDPNISSMLFFLLCVLSIADGGSIGVNYGLSIADAMVDYEDNVEGGEEGIGLNMVDVVDAGENRDSQVSSSHKGEILGIESDNFEPHDGIEFESHEAAYSFYQEYAKSMGFTTSIKNSRRSKKTKEFIDAKFACSRYGVTPESESGSSRRPSVKKTDCKASMHVKRKRDGKWYIHEFVKEHNHELLPALAYHFRIHRNVKLAEKNNIDILHAVSERTRKMYVEMSRQSGGSFNSCLKENPGFFYAIDLNEDQRLRNLFWVDAKTRKDYISFNDAVFFDTSYIKISEKMPIALFLGSNGGQAPTVIITDPDKQLKSAVEEVFPYSRHCYALWHILERIHETLAHRSESVNSFYDKYIHKKINLKEFVRQYGAILQNRKFQVEVLGVVGCHPKKEKEMGANVIFRVDDCEKTENFVVTWNEAKSEVSCSCLMFEYKEVDKDAKSRQAVVDGNERIQTRVQRYNDLCKRAIELGEEGSLSEENYNIACRALVEALKNCVNVNNRTAVECSNNSVGLRCAEEENQLLHVTKANRKKNTNKKRKLQPEPEAVVIEAPDSLQQMENLSSEGITLNGYYGSQQHVHGLLNLMEPPHDAYYVSQQTMQGLGQLNSIASSHDGFYGAQQSMPGLGHLDFRQPAFTYSMGDEHNVRPAQLHGTARHA